MKNYHTTIIQWAILASLIISGCGRRTNPQQSGNLSLIAGIQNGGPRARMIEQLTRMYPCQGAPHLVNTWEIDTTTGATRLTNRTIFLDTAPSIATAVGAFSITDTDRINPPFQNGYGNFAYRNSFIIVQDFGRYMEVATLLCGAGTYDPNANFAINNTIIGGQITPLLVNTGFGVQFESVPRISYDITQKNCLLAQVGAANFSFQVAGTVNNPNVPNSSGIIMSFSSLDIVLGSVPGICASDL
jgi:hypothetical protein